MMKILVYAITVVLFVIAPPVLAKDFDRNYTELVDAISENPRTADAVWLEMLNALDEWEKIVLVFGFAGRGDWV
jgi:hypothetical protein